MLNHLRDLNKLKTNENISLVTYQNSQDSVVRKRTKRAQVKTTRPAMPVLKNTSRTSLGGSTQRPVRLCRSLKSKEMSLSR